MITVPLLARHCITQSESQLIQQVILTVIHRISFNFNNSSFYQGNVYIADFSNQRIRKVTVSTGIILTVVGTGTADYSGDNGPATSATLNYPYCVALDLSGTHSSLLWY